MRGIRLTRLVRVDSGVVASPNDVGDFNTVLQQGVDFMAGGGYRLAAVSVAAQFDGKDGHQEGDYVLVMPENDTLPIVTGREWLGMPKFFADISSIREKDGHLRCEASMWGHLLFGIDIATPLKEQNIVVRKAAGIQSSKRPSFGYKYIAALNGPPDADYPTIMWSDIEIDQLWLGKSGELYFGDPPEYDIGDFKPIIDALKSLFRAFGYPNRSLFWLDGAEKR